MGMNLLYQQCHRLRIKALNIYLLLAEIKQPDSSIGLVTPVSRWVPLVDLMSQGLPITYMCNTSGFF